MSWFHEHLTLVYGITVGLIVVAGAVLVSNKFSTNSESTQYTWGSYGGGNRFVPTENLNQSLTKPLPLKEQFSVADLFHNLETNPERTNASFVAGNIPIVSAIKNSTSTVGTFKFDEASIEQLLASLKPSAKTQALPGAQQGVAYYYVPKNISVPPPPPNIERSETQLALYNYGNDAGTPIELYATLWGSTQAFIHRGFVEDRSDPEKVAELLRLADGLSDVAASLKELENIQAQVTKQRARLVKAYEAMAEKTRAIAGAKTDDAVLAAVESYNTTADDFLIAYLSVASVFSLNGVTFSPEESGRVFVYSGDPTQATQ